MKIFILCLALMLSIGPCFSAPPHGYEAEYKLMLGPLTVGKMGRTLSITSDGAYEFQSHIRSTGMTSILRKDELMETSAGSIERGIVTPTRYTYIRHNKKKPRNIVTVFDHTNKTVETTVNDRHVTIPLKDGMLDKLSYQAALMFDLQQNRVNLQYLVANKNEEKRYAPSIGEPERIDTALGQYTAIPVVRARTKDKRRTILWCAPDLGYVPIRVDHRDKDGTETIAILTKFERLNAQ